MKKQRSFESKCDTELCQAGVSMGEMEINQVLGWGTPRWLCSLGQ